MFANSYDIGRLGSNIEWLISKRRIYRYVKNEMLRICMHASRKIYRLRAKYEANESVACSWFVYVKAFGQRRSIHRCDRRRHRKTLLSAMFSERKIIAHSSLDFDPTGFRKLAKFSTFIGQLLKPDTVSLIYRSSFVHTTDIHEKESSYRKNRSAIRSTMSRNKENNSLELS